MPSHLVLDTQAGRFACLTLGEKAAPVVLCLHGFPDHPPSFVPVMHRLADAGFRAVAPWMRGYAPSVTEGPFHSDQLAADVIAMAEAASPDATVALLGHDWGAVASYTALAVAPQRFRAAVTLAVPHPAAFLSNLWRHPDQLRRSSYMFLFQIPKVAEKIVARDHYAFIDRLWQKWSPSYAAPQDDMEAIKWCLANSGSAPLAYYRAMAWPLGAAIARFRAAGSRPIGTPTLNLMGGEDGCIAPAAARGQQRMFRGPFEMRVLDRAGHFMQLDDPDAVAVAALAWFGTHS